MASALTGRVAVITVSGTVLTGGGGELGEASVTLGDQRGKFNPVGTNIAMHSTGMKTVVGTLTKRWTSTAQSGGLFQALIDGDNEFNVTINITGGGQFTVSGCLAGERSVRTAPGSEVMNETMTFTGLDWGQIA